MSHRFVPVDRDQQFLLPPDLRLWLPADHEVWFVIDLVEQLDLELPRCGGQLILGDPEEARPDGSSSEVPRRVPS